MLLYTLVSIYLKGFIRIQIIRSFPLLQGTRRSTELVVNINLQQWRQVSMSGLVSALSSSSSSVRSELISGHPCTGTVLSESVLWGGQQWPCRVDCTMVGGCRHSTGHCRLLSQALGHHNIRDTTGDSHSLPVVTHTPIIAWAPTHRRDNTQPEALSTERQSKLPSINITSAS